jgi:hypothetical protein
VNTMVVVVAVVSDIVGLFLSFLKYLNEELKIRLDACRDNLRAGSPISLLISTGAQLSRGAPTPHGIGPPPFQFDFVFFTAILHISVIILCCFGLGIRDPWTWYKESSVRAQRAAYERAESRNVEPE